MMFGQISNGGTNAEPVVWHALRPQGESWTTVCTAATARPGLTVIATSSQPGPVLCRLKRCQVAEWTDEGQ
jgi:hypothetical protein